MILNALIALFALVGLLFLVRAVRQFRRRRVIAGAFSSASGLVMVLAAACIGLVGFGLQGFHRLTYERPVAELQFTQTGERQFNAVLKYPSGQSQEFALRGDEWQIDARVLSWNAFVNVIGFDAAYRLERLGGRYGKIEDERSAARTVYALNPPAQIDLWEIARRYREWTPWVDAYYGSATYVPMADGALYGVKVTQKGLTARPLNQAAKKAVGNWE
jgi:hypothetical protein